MNSEQRKVLQISRRLNDLYADDFVGWVKENIVFEGLMLDGLTEQQVDIGGLVTSKKKVCISAGGGIGKTAVVALLTQWFLTTFPFSKVPTTAPTGRQLEDILWSEIRLWHKRNKLNNLIITRKGKIYMRGFPEWYAVARTVPRDGKDLNDTLAGFHAPHLLIVVDEASGVPDPVFTALDGAMTQDNAYIILISNPVSTGGYYYDTISEPEGKGKNFAIRYYDSRESPLVSADYEQNIITRYGKDSPMYKAKVQGLPISLLESVVVAPDVYDKITSQNTLHSLGNVILSTDVGGAGKDKSVLCHRVGNSIVEWNEHDTSDTAFLEDEIMRIWDAKYRGKAFCAVVDAHGIGAGLYSNLRRHNMFPVIGFIGPEKAFHDTMFDIKRTEGYWKLHKSFEDLHFPVQPPKRLKKELANLRFDFDKGPIAMEPKLVFKRRVGISPDYADALMMTCAVDSYTIQAFSHINKSNVQVFERLRQARTASQRFGKFSRFVSNFQRANW